MCSWRDSDKGSAGSQLFSVHFELLHRTYLDATIALRNSTQITICRFAEDLAGAEVVHLLQEAEVASALVEVSSSSAPRF